MQKLSMPVMKHEMMALIHINMVINDLIAVMKVSVTINIQPMYFTKLCRHVINIVDDSSYLTNNVKQVLRSYLTNQVHKTHVLEYQRNQLEGFTDKVGDIISTLRESILVKE